MTNGGTSRITRAHTADHRQPADAAELMHGRRAAEIGALSDFHVTAQHRAVGQDDVIFHGAIVRHVRADHEQAAVADPRDVPGLQRPVDGAIFAKHVAVADFRRARMLGHVDVLRHAAEHRAFEHQIVAAQNRSRLHRHAAGQMTAVAQHDSGFDDTERPDSHVGSELGVRTNDSKRVNRHGWVLSEMARWARQVRDPCLQTGCRADYGSPPAASDAFITIGRNNCAGLAAGGDFSVRDVPRMGEQRQWPVTLEELTS